MRPALPMSLLALIAAAPPPAADPEAPPPPGRVAGTPRTCITIGRYGSATVDHGRILYKPGGGI